MIYNIFSSIIFLAFALAAVAFSMANIQEISVSLNPLPFTLTAPLYLLFLICVICSFIAGALAAYVAGLKYKYLLRRKDRQIEELQRRIKQNPV